MAIYDSMLNFAHDFTRTIEEIFVPSEEGIIFNVVNNDVLNVFSASEPRCHEKTQVQKITVDVEFVRQLQAFIKLKEECLTKAKTHFAKE